MQSSLLASGLALTPNAIRAYAEVAPSSVAVSLTIDPSRTSHRILPSFMGLSYEQVELMNPNFFSSTNQPLIGFIRKLGRQGVLRIGGNSSEFLSWAGSSNQKTISSSGSASSQSHRFAAITPESVDNLKQFLEHTGWSLIYGLNFGHGTPEQAAEQAAYVMQKIGRDRLVAFQVGNEPDAYHENGIRKPNYTYEQYAQEWKRFFVAIRRRVPNAPFAGPDTAYNTQWVLQFAEEFKDDLQFASSHYYAEGPPSNPGMNIARLLHGTSRGLSDEIAAIADVKAKTGLAFRLTETNSCYGGGKWGVSNTFASALWAVDLMYAQAETGCIGMNFHDVTYKPYSPIVGSLEAGFLARPEYYGLLLFSLVGPGQLVAAQLSGAETIPLLKTYALRGADGRMRVVLINKDTQTDAQIKLTGIEASKGRLIRLEAPSVDDANDVTLGGSPIGQSGEWSALVEETLSLRNSTFQLRIPKGTAAFAEFS